MRPPRLPWILAATICAGSVVWLLLPWRWSPPPTPEPPEPERPKSPFAGDDLERIPTVDVVVRTAEGAPAPSGTEVHTRPAWVPDVDFVEWAHLTRRAEVVAGVARLEEIPDTETEILVLHPDFEPIGLETRALRDLSPFVLGAGPGVTVHLGGPSATQTACEWVKATRDGETRGRRVPRGQATVRFADLGAGPWTLTAGGHEVPSPPSIEVIPADQDVDLPCLRPAEVTVEVVPALVPAGSRVEVRATRTDQPGEPVAVGVDRPDWVRLGLLAGVTYDVTAVRDGRAGPATRITVGGDGESGGRHLAVTQPDLGVVRGCVEGMRAEDAARVTGYVLDAAVGGLLRHVEGSACFEGQVPAGTHRIGVSGHGGGERVRVRTGETRQVRFTFVEEG